MIWDVRFANQCVLACILILSLFFIGQISADAGSIPSPEQFLKLGKAEKQKWVPTLLEKLNRADPEERFRAEEIIEELGPEMASAVPDLIRALHCTDKQTATGRPCYNQSILGALSGMGPAAHAASPTLALLLGNAGDRQEIREILKTLIDIHPDASSIQVLTPFLENAAKNTDLCYLAVEALGKTRQLPATLAPTLVGVIAKDNQACNAAAAEVLAKMGSNAKQAAPSLIGLLHDGRDNVRIHAAYAIRQLDPSIILDARELFHDAPRKDCRANGFDFSLIVPSFHYGEWDEFTSGIWIVRSNSPVAVSFLGSWCELIESQDKNPFCGDVLVFESKKKLIIPVFRDWRDWEARLAAFVYDPVTMAVVAADDSLGNVVTKMKSTGEGGRILPPSYEALPDGFRFEDRSRCEGQGPVTINGESGGASACSIPIWWDVIFDGRKLQKILNRTLTWEHSELRPFFSGQQDFERFFALKDLAAFEGQGTGRRAWRRRQYRRAMLNNGFLCFLRDLKWVCENTKTPVSPELQLNEK